MEEYTVVWKWVEKILQCHYTLCQVYLFSREPLCSNCFCFWFFCVCVCVSVFSFWFGVQKNGCGAFIWKLSESLKARRLHQQVCFCVLLVFIDSVLAYGEMCRDSPLKTLIHSRWDRLDTIQKRLLLMGNDWQLGVTGATEPSWLFQAPSLEQRHTVLGTITMETHAKKRAFSSPRKKNEDLKKCLFFLFHLDSGGIKGLQ